MSLVKRSDVLFPSLINEIFNPDWFGGIDNLRVTAPAVNIKENEKDYELELMVPGREKNDFNIEIDKNLMTVSSDITQDDSKTEENYTRREFSYSSFKRSFTLPDSVDVDNIKAAYENGLLKFTLPKKKEALPKPKRLIELS